GQICGNRPPTDVRGAGGFVAPRSRTRPPIRDRLVRAPQGFWYVIGGRCGFWRAQFVPKGLSLYFRRDQHLVGCGFEGDADAEQRAERRVRRAPPVEPEDEFVEVCLEMILSQPVTDAQGPEYSEERRRDAEKTRKPRSDALQKRDWVIAARKLLIR